MSVTKIPAFAVSHGAPNMILYKQDKTTMFLASLGKQIVKAYNPKAILVVSAHWETSQFEVTNSESPETIHDFGGFEDEMYEQQYPAKTSPELVNRVIDLLNTNKIPCKANNNRGFDHGAWMPLKIMFPAATIPVVQLSLKRNLNIEEHIALGRALKPLREEGYLVVGSGGATHNLRTVFGGGYFKDPSKNPNKLFDEWLTNTLVNHQGPERDQLLKKSPELPFFFEAHPRTEHLIPFYVIAGMDGKAEKIHGEWAFENLSLSTYKFE